MNIAIMTLGLIIMVGASYLWLRTDNTFPDRPVSKRDLLTLYSLVLGLIVFSFGAAWNIVTLAKS